MKKIETIYTCDCCRIKKSQGRILSVGGWDVCYDCLTIANNIQIIFDKDMPEVLNIFKQQLDNIERECLREPPSAS